MQFILASCCPFSFHQLAFLVSGESVCGVLISTTKLEPEHSEPSTPIPDDLVLYLLFDDQPFHPPSPDTRSQGLHCSRSSNTMEPNEGYSDLAHLVNDVSI
ncbi:uncharacterized protein BJX67DRAFT_367350, partial [Aspergillus lucknowensis]